MDNSIASSSWKPFHNHGGNVTSGYIWMDGFNPVQCDRFFGKKKLKKKVVGLKVRPNPIICSPVYETGRERKPESKDRREKVETQNDLRKTPT